MIPSSSTRDQSGRTIPWLGIGKFLLLAIMTIMFFLLAQSMVRHRFHRGGWVNKHDTLKP
jgi:ABC-type microcin C transport system permease subunit YejE